MEDKTMTCVDCGETFVFTVSEQEFYKEKGFANEPKRCKTCRDKKKAERNSGRSNYNNNSRY
ncbi:MAG: zinc-ribbon domain-containing protein [Bacilli bacterium]|nr:zinc-ribbon domain-containing protein [Bacilli bacterium]